MVDANPLLKSRRDAIEIDCRPVIEIMKDADFDLMDDDAIDIIIALEDNGYKISKVKEGD